jgi:hypothetical protein
VPATGSVVFLGGGARTLLRDMLVGGEPVPESTFRELAKEEDISWSTMKNVKRKLRIKSVRSEMLGTTRRKDTGCGSGRRERPGREFSPHDRREFRARRRVLRCADGTRPAQTGSLKGLIPFVRPSQPRSRFSAKGASKLSRLPWRRARPWEGPESQNGPIHLHVR